MRRRGGRSAGFVPPPSTRPLVEPVSTVEEGYFASFAFYRRVGAVAVVAVVAFTLLAMRAWSLELLHSRDYLKQSQAQQLRVVNLPAARGTIVDDKQRPLATAGAQLAVVADAFALGPAPLDATWRPTARGRRTLDTSSAHHSPVSPRGPRIAASAPGREQHPPRYRTPPQPVVLYRPAATSRPNRGSA